MAAYRNPIRDLGRKAPPVAQPALPAPKPTNDPTATPESPEASPEASGQDLTKPVTIRLYPRQIAKLQRIGRKLSSLNASLGAVVRNLIDRHPE